MSVLTVSKPLQDKYNQFVEVLKKRLNIEDYPLEDFEITDVTLGKDSDGDPIETIKFMSPNLKSNAFLPDWGLDAIPFSLTRYAGIDEADLIMERDNYHTEYICDRGIQLLVEGCCITNTTHPSFYPVYQHNPELLEAVVSDLKTQKIVEIDPDFDD